MSSGPATAGPTPRDASRPRSPDLVDPPLVEPYLTGDDYEAEGGHAPRPVTYLLRDIDYAAAKAALSMLPRRRCNQFQTMAQQQVYGAYSPTKFPDLFHRIIERFHQGPPDDDDDADELPSRPPPLNRTPEIPRAFSPLGHCGYTRSSYIERLAKRQKIPWCVGCTVTSILSLHETSASMQQATLLRTSSPKSSRSLRLLTGHGSRVRPPSRASSRPVLPPALNRATATDSTWYAAYSAATAQATTTEQLATTAGITRQLLEGPPNETAAVLAAARRTAPPRYPCTHCGSLDHIDPNCSKHPRHVAAAARVVAKDLPRPVGALTVLAVRAYYAEANSAPPDEDLMGFNDDGNEFPHADPLEGAENCLAGQ
ncbi:hypothetical protein VE00_08675 [Pseudogymnoascus sp. WSF 3629]|nr:hypothetical protein VE00_08675 [Pseudogymnoascus sp. WSF 3629]